MYLIIMGDLFRVSFAVCGLKVSIPRWAPWRPGTPKNTTHYALNVRYVTVSIASREGRGSGHCKKVGLAG